jgi:hypothetical protein
MNSNWLEIAKRRWPTHCIGGGGRFAVYSPSMGPLSKILLFETRSDAEKQIVDPRFAHVVDLAQDIEALERQEREDRRQQKKLNDLRQLGFAK